MNLLPVLLTCYHVLPLEEIADGKKIELHFNNDKLIKNISIDKTRKIYISNEEEYDITMIEIKKDDGFNFETFLEIDNINYNVHNENNNIVENISVYLIHYPKGLEAKLSFGTIKNIFYDINLIKHNATTNKGTSGSPIFNVSTQKIIGIHKGDHEKYKFKLGTLLKGPINEFNSNKKQNEIIITVDIKKDDVNEYIYFLDNTDYINKETKIKNYHNNLKELNKNNTILYINDKLVDFNKYFKPEKEGIYSIRLLFSIKIKDCSFMFTNCTNIIDIDFSLFNTENTTNMECMFSGCSNLLKLDLTSFNTKNVINMRGMFGECSKVLNYNYLTDDFFNSEEKAEDAIYYDGCSNLIDLDLSSFDTYKVLDMSYMFCGCKNLTNLKISSNFNTKNVSNYYGMFGCCENLDYLDLSSFDSKKANILTGMFYQCYNLTNIVFSSSFTCENVTNMSGMFGSCESLEKLDLSHYDTKNVVMMSGMFLECYRLTNLDLSSFITTGVIDMHSMFSGSYNLKNLNLLKFDTRKVKKIEGMFFCCSGGLNINVLNTEYTKNILDEYKNRTISNIYGCPLAGCNRRHHAKWYKPI